MSNELTRNPGQFNEVIHIIDNARSRAMKAVNAELIQMYWEIGAYISGSKLCLSCFEATWLGEENAAAEASKVSR